MKTGFSKRSISNTVGKKEYEFKITYNLKQLKNNNILEKLHLKLYYFLEVV